MGEGRGRGRSRRGGQRRGRAREMMAKINGGRGRCDRAGRGFHSEAEQEVSALNVSTRRRRESLWSQTCRVQVCEAAGWEIVGRAASE